MFLVLDSMILVSNISAFFFLLIKKKATGKSRDLILKYNTDVFPKIVIELLSPVHDNAKTQVNSF